MDRELEAPKSSILCGIMRIFSALSISTGAIIYQTGAPFDKTLEYHHLLLMATILTFYLAMALLLICVAMDTTARPPNPAAARWIHHLGTAIHTASFMTLALSVLPAEAYTYTAFVNSTFFSSQTVSWASESGLILVAIAMAYRVIIKMPTSWFQQYTKVGLFTLCVAVAGMNAESKDFMTSSFRYNSVIYQTYCIYCFGLVPCTFVLGVLLLILSIAVPDTDIPTGHFVSVICKEVFTKLTLSVGSVTLLAGAFLAVNLLTIGPAVLGGGSGAGDGAGPW